MNPEHRKFCDDYVEEVLNTINTCAEKSLTLSNIGTCCSKNPSFKKIAGWNELVKSYKNDAMFWFSIWLSAGKPLNCELHNIMCRTKNIYHYQVEKCKKAEDQIRKGKLLSAVLDPNSEINLFDEIKKLTNAKSSYPNKINHKSEHIDEHFAGIYRTLYNSVDDQNDLLEVASTIDAKISPDCAAEVRNGCKQGAELSAIAYCVYVNGLFEELSRNRSGCWIQGTFLGSLGYSDDNFLLAPSREALQSMLYICEKYATRHELKFSTDFNPGLANPKTHPKNPPKNPRVFQIKKPTDKRVFFIKMTILQRFSTY